MKKVQLPKFFSFEIKTIDDVLYIESYIINLIDTIKALFDECKDIPIDTQTVKFFTNVIFKKVVEKEHEIESYKLKMNLYLLLGSNIDIKKKIDCSMSVIDKKFYESIFYNKDIYFVYELAYKEILKHNSLIKNYIKIDAFQETKKYLEETLKDYKKRGILLSFEDQKKLQDISREIDTLSRSFSSNIYKTKNHLLIKKADLVGLKKEQLAKLSCDENDLCYLGVDSPTKTMIMSYCDNEETRKLMYNQYTTVAYPDNVEVLKKIRVLSQEKASILGYKDYPSFDIEENMAKSVSNVEKMILNIDDATKKKAKKEKDILSNFVLREIFSDKKRAIEPWDIEYIYEKYKNKYFHISDDLISEYFPVKHTLEKIFKIYETFFDIHFEFVEYEKGSWKYSEDTSIVRVFEKNGKIIGDIILDLFPRENKYSHACCCSIVSPTRSILKSDDTKEDFGIRGIVANFNRPTKDRDGLLSFYEVQIFFHELGHALHGLFSVRYFCRYTGLAVANDFVEVPSQLLEQWMFEKDLIKNISCHYKTKEALSDKCINNIINSKNFNVSLFYQRQLSQSAFSLNIYLHPYKSIEDILKDISKQFVFLSDYDVSSKAYCSFEHISASIYGSKYYVYLWSLIYAIDFFVYIKKNNGLLNNYFGKRLRSIVLEKGGSIDPNILIENFLDRPPSIESFYEYLNKR